MTVAQLESILRSLGWEPLSGRSVTVRMWKRKGDDRSPPEVLLVPRTDWIPRARARQILLVASRPGLR